MFIIIQEAKTSEEKERIFQFRYKIYSQELDKKISGIDHERKRFTEAELDDDSCILAAVEQNTGKIVGTIRTVLGAQRAFPASLIDYFQLQPLIDQIGLQHLSYSGAFMIDPAYRGKTVASLLIGHIYMVGISRGVQVDICKCELALVHLYYQIGYRPYLRPTRFSHYSGFRQPLALTAMDRNYLCKTSSPFAQLLREGVDDDHGSSARTLSSLYPCFESPAVQPQSARALWAGIAIKPTSTDEGFLFEDMQEASITKLLEKFPKISVAKGEYIYLKDERERGMGLLLTGELGVTSERGHNPHFLALLRPPDIFGEMSLFLNKGRSANLFALQDSTILLLPYNLLKKLDADEPEISRLLRNNLCKILAGRLNMMNNHVAGILSANEKPFRTGMNFTGINFSCGDSAEERQIAVESYSFASLGDQGRELQRLEHQARISQQIEASWFRKIGFHDGATFLDVGSGPGVTSFLLAKTFPESRVIGIEPEGLLRKRAEKQAQILGHAGQCTFIEGSGEKISLPDNSINCSYCRFLFQHLPDPVAVLRELFRVVSPGGIVAVLDVDDMGVIMHPEPEGFEPFRKKVNLAQSRLGGDRQVSKKMLHYMLEAGFSSPRIEVIPITSQLMPICELLDIAFSFKAQTLKRVGLWSSEDEVFLSELSLLKDEPGAWIYVPVFLAHATVPH